MQLTDEQKKNRIAQLQKEIESAVTELYEIVAPTEPENDEAESLIWDDVKSEAETLIDEKATIGKLYLVDNALMLRELAEEDAHDPND